MADSKIRQERAFMNSYTTLSQLGITASSATVSNIYIAMPYGSVGIFQNSDVSDAPTGNYMIVIYKVNAVRGHIVAYSKAQNVIYDMLLNDSNGNPTGTWLKRVTVKQKSLTNVTSDSNGAINTGLYTTNGEYPISVHCPVNTCSAQIVGTYQNQWQIQLFALSDNSVQKNKTVSEIVVYYIG